MKTHFNRWLIFGLCFFFFLFSFSPITSASLASLRSVRYHSYPEKTRIVLNLDRPSRYVVETTSPKTISIEIRGLQLRGERRTGHWEINDGFIKNIIARQHASKVKLLINLEKEFRNHDVFSLKAPHRLVVDIWKKEAPTEERPSVFLGKVVIDSGHGGRDPGAIGPTGLKEKGVNLDIARRVKRILEKEGVEVIMTRNDDRFISLTERALIANRNKADLFVSIHCNAAFSRSATGFETFFPSPALDDLTRARRAVESYRGTMGLGSPRNRELLTILADLKYTSYRKESIMLARLIQDNFSKILDTPNRGVKPGNFYVLRNVNAPAVLVEVGFISNRREEERLRQASHREKIAQSLADSILKFKREFDRTSGFSR